jgi:hypothetical protein
MSLCERQHVLVVRALLSDAPSVIYCNGLRQCQAEKPDEILGRGFEWMDEDPRLWVWRIPVVNPDLPAPIAAVVVDPSVAGEELQQAAQLTAMRTEALSHRTGLGLRSGWTRYSF